MTPDLPLPLTDLLYKPVDRVTRSTLVLHVSHQSRCKKSFNFSLWMLIFLSPPSPHTYSRTFWSTHPPATQTIRYCRTPYASLRTSCLVLTKRSPLADSPWPLKRERSVWKTRLILESLSIQWVHCWCIQDTRQYEVYKTDFSTLAFGTVLSRGQAGVSRTFPLSGVLVPSAKDIFQWFEWCGGPVMRPCTTLFTPSTTPTFI